MKTITYRQLRKLVMESETSDSDFKIKDGVLVNESWDGEYNLNKVVCYFDDDSTPSPKLYVKFGPDFPEEEALLKALTRRFHKEVWAYKLEDACEEDSDEWLVWTGGGFGKDKEAKPAKMHAYIRVIEKDNGKPHWYVDDCYKENRNTGAIKYRPGAEQYFSNDGYWDIYFPGSDETRGTAFPDMPSLKQAIKDARSLANWNYYDYELEVWMLIKGDFKLVKLNKDGSFAVIGDYEKDMHAERDKV